MEYRYKKIAELGKIITGKTPPTENEAFFGGNYPFITPSDICSYDEKYLVDTERSISSLGSRKLKGMLLPKGSICFVCIGSTIGKMCMTNKESYTNQQINSIIPNREYDNNYLFYYLRHIKGYFQSIGAGTGSGKGIINKTLFSKTKICVLEDKDCQKKIASILSAYDNLIENNNKRIKILEQMAENLYKEWFVRFRFPDHEVIPFENGIPKGWSEEKLSVVFEVKYGKDHKNIEDGLIPIFGSGGIMRYGNKALCSEEAVLIPRKGSLNNVMYYKGDFWTVDTMFYTKMKIKHCAKYTYFTLSKVDLEGLNSGASIPSMTTDILYHLKMIVPDESTLIAFDKQIDALFAEKDHLEIQNQNLIKQRDLLLPRLMSGKLKV